MSAVAIAELVVFRMGRDGRAHLCRPHLATALDGAPTLGAAPTDGSVPACERCIALATDLILAAEDAA